MSMIISFVCYTCVESKKISNCIFQCTHFRDLQLHASVLVMQCDLPLLTIKTKHNQLVLFTAPQGYTVICSTGGWVPSIHPFNIIHSNCIIIICKS